MNPAPMQPATPEPIPQLDHELTVQECHERACNALALYDRFTSSRYSMNQADVMVSQSHLQAAAVWAELAKTAQRPGVALELDTPVYDGEDDATKWCTDPACPQAWHRHGPSDHVR